MGKIIQITRKFELESLGELFDTSPDITNLIKEDRAILSN
jgi:hypothetical protein